MGREFGQDNNNEGTSSVGKGPKRPLLMAFGVILVFGIMLIIGLAVSGRRTDDYYYNRGNDGDNSNDPADFRRILPHYTKPALENESSPQSLALYWLSIDPSYNTYTMERRMARFALATLFYATGGETSWQTNTDWLSYVVHECEWYSTSSYSLCQHLELTNNGLSGTIPKEIALLGSNSQPSRVVDIRRLVLNNNKHLTGTIPTQLSHLARVTDLHLEHCGLTGTIPARFFFAGTDHHLESIHLHDNSLTGSLPRQLSKVSNMKFLTMSHNSITGTIPSVLNELSQLEMLQLNNNQLTGAIPSTLGDLTNLRALHLQNNPLLPVNSAVPMEVCSLFDVGHLSDLTIDCDSIHCSCDCKCGST